MGWEEGDHLRAQVLAFKILIFSLQWHEKTGKQSLQNKRGEEEVS